MGLLLVCQDAVSDVSDGQTDGPRALPSTLHDIESSGRSDKLTILRDTLIVRSANICIFLLMLTRIPYLSNKGLVTLDPVASSVWTPAFSPVLLITGTAKPPPKKKSLMRLKIRCQLLYQHKSLKQLKKNLEWDGNEAHVGSKTLWLTFIIGQLANDPGGLVSVEVDLQDVTEPLRVQIAPGSDHVRRRQAALPPGDVGHDVHWDQMGSETGSKTTTSQRKQMLMIFIDA